MAHLSADRQSRIQVVTIVTRPKVEPRT